MHNFAVTESASSRISYLLNQEDDKDLRFRVEVLGGGCSGFQYKFDFDNKSDSQDVIFTQGGIEVVVDSGSLELVKGSILDYVETLGSAAFIIKNPNATANCGCGNSFSV